MFPAELFAALYANGYDIIVWSATGHKWIEAKLRETGVSSHPAYKITACMVRAAPIFAIRVFSFPLHPSPRRSRRTSSEIKPSPRRTTPRW